MPGKRLRGAVYRSDPRWDGGRVCVLKVAGLQLQRAGLQSAVLDRDQQRKAGPVRSRKAGPRTRNGGRHCHPLWVPGRPTPCSHAGGAGSKTCMTS